MKVEQISYHKDETCACGSWLDHWYKFSDVEIHHCQASQCEEPVFCGAHVRKADSHDRNWYIVPLCETHSHSTYHVDMIMGTPLVLADASQTCEKE
jgi:hypothetical protein